MSLLSKLSAFVAIFALAQPALSSSCVSRGIDFWDEGHYFINEASSENFTAVTQFDGCSGGYANIILVDVDGKRDWKCSQISVTPDDVPQLSTCPVLKSEMESGHWLLLIQGNNGDVDPFDYQRDLYLTVGPQVTATITNTVTWDITSTPIETITAPTTVWTTETIPNSQTITSPSSTAKRTRTITPKAYTTWATKTFTRKRHSWTKLLTTVTKTETATCTVPPKPSTHDKVAVYRIQEISVGATPTAAQSVGKRDKRVDSSVARRMLGNRLRGMSASERIQERRLQERAPDSETITVTDPTPYNVTVTHTAPATTTTEEVLVTETTATTLPPTTVYSGVTMVTVTAPTPTKTSVKHTYTTVNIVKTLYRTWTYTTTVTPTASLSACKSRGGHFKPKPRA